MGRRLILAHRRPRQRRRLPARRARAGADLLGHAGRVRAVRRHRRLRGADAGGVRDRAPAGDDRRWWRRWRCWRRRPRSAAWCGAARPGASRARCSAWGVLPAACPALLAWLAARPGVPAALQIAVAVLLVVPIAPLLARVVFQPIADASVLVLLIVSLALHFLLSGLGLLFFGPEGSRTAAARRAASLALGDGFIVSGQVVLMVGVGDRAERPASSWSSSARWPARRCARPRSTASARGWSASGRRAPRCSPTAARSLLAGLIGVLIAPVTTMYYDSGFIIGLKAFVAAIIGGLVSYPVTAIGALAVGLVESFASFWSGALKDVIVFSLLIPVLLLRSFLEPACRRGGRGGRRMNAATPRRSRDLRGRRAVRASPSRSRRCVARQLHASRCSTTSASARWSRSAWCCSPASAARPRSARPRSSASPPTRRAWLTTAQGMSPWLGLVFALLLTGLSALAIGVADAAPRRPLPAAAAPSPGACRSRCCSATSMRSAATPACRTFRRCTIGGWSLADPRAIYYLIWALVGPGLAVQLQPAAVAAGPRDPQPARRRDRCWRASAPTPTGCGSTLFVTRRAARRPRRLALRAHEPLRQPVAVRRARRASSTC